MVVERVLGTADTVSSKRKGKLMSKRLAIASIALVIFAAAPVLAQCQHQGETAKSKQCSMKEGHKCSMQCQSAGKHATKADTATCSSDVTCDGDTVRVKGVDIPRIGFKVADKLTCCMKSAKEMAEGDEAKIKFVVADKTFDRLIEAKAARVKVLEKYYDEMFTVKYAVGDQSTRCPLAAKDLAKKAGKEIRYRVVAFNFSDPAEAEKASKTAREAGDKVAMNWAVGDRKFDCPMRASDAAKDKDKKVEYCVGDRKTTCQTTAKMALNEARIKAALEALAKAVGEKPEA